MSVARALTAAFALSLLPLTAAAQDITRVPLQAYRVPGVATDVITVLSELLPDRTTGRHTHPGVEMTYVTEGEIVLKIDGQAERVVKAGESYLVESGVAHEIVAGPSKNAKIVITFVVARGQLVTTTLP
ncbi:MAG: cupin domain-containing protein [Bauldia sp.]